MMLHSSRLTPDRIQLLWWLWMMPLATTDQLARASGLTGNRVHRGLAWLRRHGWATRRSLAGPGRRQDRYWLTRAGVLMCAHEHNLPVWWQVSERAIVQLIRRLPVVEHLYDQALGLWEKPYVSAGRHPFLDLEELGPEDLPDSDLTAFQWREGDVIDAVAQYDWRWFCMLWAGPEWTYHRLGHRARDATTSLWKKAGPDFEIPIQPAGWMVICADVLAAAHAAHWWTGDDVLVETVDGHYERPMTMTGSVSPCPTPTAISDPGHPERAARWRERDKPLAALEHELCLRVFLFIAGLRGGRLDQLQRLFGHRCARAVKELMEHGYIVQLSGGLYPTLKGGHALADLDGVERGLVLNRLRAVLKRDGEYRRGQLRHDQGLIDVHLKLLEEDITSFPGHRNLLNLPHVTQVWPDLVYRMDPRGGGALLINVELECTARDEPRRDRKLSTYQKALYARLTHIPVCWIFEEEWVRRRYEAASGDVLMMTTVAQDFFEGTSWGPNSAWLIGGVRMPIDAIVDVKERVDEALIDEFWGADRRRRRRSQSNAASPDAVQ